MGPWQLLREISIDPQGPQRGLLARIRRRLTHYLQDVSEICSTLPEQDRMFVEKRIRDIMRYLDDEESDLSSGPTEALSQETPPPFEGDGRRAMGHSSDCICAGGGRLLLAVPGRPGRREAACPYGHLDVNRGRSSGRSFDVDPDSPAPSPQRGAATHVTDVRLDRPIDDD